MVVTEVVEETTHCVHFHLFILDRAGLESEPLPNIRKLVAITVIIGIDCLDDEIFAEL